MMQVMLIVLHTPGKKLLAVYLNLFYNNFFYHVLLH